MTSPSELRAEMMAKLAEGGLTYKKDHRDAVLVAIMDAALIGYRKALADAKAVNHGVVVYGDLERLDAIAAKAQET